MPTNVEQLVRDGAERVLARAGRARSLDADALAPRLRATVEKYILRHSPEASAREVGEFLDALHADELLLVAACERGDDAAWNELIEQYRATVLSAARASSAGEAEAEELADTVWAELYGLRARGDGVPRASSRTIRAAEALAGGCAPSSVNSRLIGTGARRVSCRPRRLRSSTERRLSRTSRTAGARARRPTPKALWPNETRRARSRTRLRARSADSKPKTVCSSASTTSTAFD